MKRARIQIAVLVLAVAAIVLLSANIAVATPLCLIPGWPHPC